MIKYNGQAIHLHTAPHGALVLSLVVLIIEQLQPFLLCARAYKKLDFATCSVLLRQMLNTSTLFQYGQGCVHVVSHSHADPFFVQGHYRFCA